MYTKFSAKPVKAQGRIVGRVREGVFYKTVQASKHMWRNPPAWALDVQSLLDAERAGARLVDIHDSEAGAHYRASIDEVRRRGFVFDCGHGCQVALPLELWAVTRPGQERAEQLALFEVRQ